MKEPRIVKCIVCDKGFVASKRKETCSPECRRIVKNETQKRYRERNKDKIQEYNEKYYWDLQ